jgi:hypothetical protein
MAAMRVEYWAVAVCALCACGDPRTYVGDGTLFQVALTDTTAPALMNEDGALYVVETHAPLPIRAPSSSELSALQAGVKDYKNLPFPRLPWVERDDLALQLDFTLSNLDPMAHDVDVIVNGADEFFEYVPRVLQVDDEAPIPLHSQWEKRYHLDADARIAVTIREEELDEMAVDLATVVNGAPNSDEVVYFENKSSSDPRSQPYIPKVIPGLTALRLGLRANQAATILLEVSVRVRDVGDKLADDGEATMKLMPMLFESVIPSDDQP